MTEGDQPIETHDAEQRQTRRALAALVAFVLALAAIGAGAASWQLHKAEYDDSQANLRRFARAVTEQTAWDLHQIDTVLQLTSTWLGRSDKLEASGTARLQERVQPRLTALLVGAEHHRQQPGGHAAHGDARQHRPAHHRLRSPAAL